MAVSIKASKQGLEKVEIARKKKGWDATAPAWCDAATTSPATLKRFRRGLRIDRDVFINICQAVGLDWQEIVDSGSPTICSGSIWLVELEADETLVDNIVTLIKQHSGNCSLKLRRIERGSLVLVFEGSQEGFERIEYLFREGQLTELLGVPILDVRLAPVNLSQWLQNNFVEALQAGWQSIEEIFGTTTARPAFRANAVKRAKQIQLGDRILNLILQLTPAENQEISIILGVYPTVSETYLPENLNLTVFSESGEPLVEIPAPSQSQGIIQELFFDPGEKFSVQVSLGDFSDTEYLAILS